MNLYKFLSFLGFFLGSVSLILFGILAKDTRATSIISLLFLLILLCILFIQRAPELSCFYGTDEVVSLFPSENMSIYIGVIIFIIACIVYIIIITSMRIRKKKTLSRLMITAYLLFFTTCVITLILLILDYFKQQERETIIKSMFDDDKILPKISIENLRELIFLNSLLNKDENGNIPGIDERRQATGDTENNILSFTVNSHITPGPCMNNMMFPYYLPNIVKYYLSDAIKKYLFRIEKLTEVQKDAISDLLSKVKKMDQGRIRSDHNKILEEIFSKDKLLPYSIGVYDFDKKVTQIKNSVQEDEVSYSAEDSTV